MKKYMITICALVAILLLTGCSKSSYSQEDIGEEPETIDETTILGKWYFEGESLETIIFNDDLTYETDHDGTKGHGSYSLSDDYRTIHIKEDSTEIDEDVDVMYGKDTLYLIWKGGREQLFLRHSID